MTVESVPVIVPAHNEEFVIGSTLDALAASQGVRPEVVVVCNGCTDNTAAVARDRGVQVLETPVGSKALALELGRNATPDGVRVYLDADIVVSPDALASVVEALEQPGVHGAAPAISLRLPEGASRPMRAYAQVWRRAPYFADGLIGSGFFALSPEAQERIGPWPDLIADDLVALCHLDPNERCSTAGSFVHELPRTLRETARAEARREAGRVQFARWAQAEGRDAAEESQATAWLTDLAKKPRMWPGLAAFVGTKAWAKVVGRRRLAGDEVSWSSPARTARPTG